MPNLQTLPFDIFIFGLRIAFIGIIYLFIFQVMRVLVRDLRQVTPAETPQARPRYGPVLRLEAWNEARPPAFSPMGATGARGRRLRHPSSAWSRPPRAPPAAALPSRREPATRLPLTGRLQRLPPARYPARRTARG